MMFLADVSQFIPWQLVILLLTLLATAVVRGIMEALQQSLPKTKQVPRTFVDAENIEHWIQEERSRDERSKTV